MRSRLVDAKEEKYRGAQGGGAARCTWNASRFIALFSRKSTVISRIALRKDKILLSSVEFRDVLSTLFRIGVSRTFVDLIYRARILESSKNYVTVLGTVELTLFELD